jgi:nitroimidazol reductase NimA-like FMN-containing flavoprotein (pyridoxamine 5'-phosphate oxidase superfamily)
MLQYLENDRAEVEMIDREECFQLLSKETVGRIGLSIRGLPAVVPVRFCLLDDHIVVHTRDAKLIAAVKGQVVSFEVDDLHALDSGWSVVVTGLGFACGSPSDILVGITTEMISGRRLLKSA